MIVLLAALFTGALAAQTPAERAAQAGELLTLKNQRVLRLFAATPKERGFAQGFLLAENIRDDVNAALRSLPGMKPEKYERALLPWATAKFAWDAATVAELDGIFDGLAAKLTKDELRLEYLGRAFTRQDLDAINVIADYYGPACEGFVAWNQRTADGGVLHARTLDFPIGTEAIKDQILIVSEAAAGKQAWVAIGWPGLIGQFTGMNAAGLVACIHDADNPKKGYAASDNYYPRGLLLRHMLENIDPQAGDPAEKAAALAAKNPVACGNLFHLSWPKAAAEKNKITASAVLEVDSSSQKVDILRMDESGVQVLTNHFRIHNTPLPCERFAKITAGLELLAQAHHSIGLLEARKLMMCAEQFVAAHTVYFFPDRLEMYIALTKDNVLSPRVVPTAFTLKELFKHSPE